MATPPPSIPPLQPQGLPTFEAFMAMQENARRNFPVSDIPPAKKAKEDLSSSSSSSSSSGDSSSSSSSSSDSDEDEVDKAVVKPSDVPELIKPLGSGSAAAHKGSSSGSDDSKVDKSRNHVKILNGIFPEGPKGKLVAAGSVVNDKIRVVPVKEKTPRSANGEVGSKPRGRPRKGTTCPIPFSSNSSFEKATATNGVIKATSVKKRGRKKGKKVDDPPVYHRFKPDTSTKPAAVSVTGTPSMNGSSNNGHDDSNPLNSSGHSEESDRAFAQSLEEKDETENQKRRSHRKRQSQPIYNEDYSDRLLRDALAHGTVASSSRSSAMKTPVRRGRPTRPQKKSGSVSVTKTSADPNFEVGGDVPKTHLRPSGKTADWDIYLNARNPDILKWIAEVSKFVHTPMSDIWKDFAKPGLKIEIPNCFVDCNRPVYWIATIKHFAGYKALVQYETFGYGDKLFAWISFCSAVPKPIGYCDENEILLFPPYGVLEASQDFLHLLRSVIHDYSLTTLKKNHVDIIASAIKSKAKYQLEDVIEAMDCSLSHIRRLAKVTGIIADRIHVSYMTEGGSGFWFNVESDCVRPLGWCQAVGVELSGVPTKTVFPQFDVSTMPFVPEEMYFRKNMVFEVIHPLHLDRIASGCVEKVYKYGYFMARIECNAPLIHTMRFIFHISSPWIMPCGFCAKHGIDLVVPRGEREQGFNWDTYCSIKGMKKLDLSSLPPRRANPFIPGEKFEAIDLRQPNFCCPVTVLKLAGHLLYLHFDGWSRKSNQAFQWIDCDSPDIYPAGWSELTGHEFQGHPDLPKVEDHTFRII